MKFRLFLILFCLPFLAGCHGGNFWDDWFGSKSVDANAPKKAEIWCYRTLGEPACYEQPQSGEENRLIASDLNPQKNMPAPMEPVAAILLPASPATMPPVDMEEGEDKKIPDALMPAKPAAGEMAKPAIAEKETAKNGPTKLTPAAR